MLMMIDVNADIIIVICHHHYQRRQHRPHQLQQRFL